MACCNVRNRLKFGKITKKDLLCTKTEKNGYRDFDHSGTLSVRVTVLSSQVKRFEFPGKYNFGQSFPI